MRRHSFPTPPPARYGARRGAPMRRSRRSQTACCCAATTTTISTSDRKAGAIRATSSPHCWPWLSASELAAPIFWTHWRSGMTSRSRLFDTLPAASVGWDYSNLTAIGAVCALARLRKLTPQQTREALAIAVVPHLASDEIESGDLNRAWRSDDVEALQRRRRNPAGGLCLRAGGRRRGRRGATVRGKVRPAQQARRQRRSAGRACERS